MFSALKGVFRSIGDLKCFSFVFKFNLRRFYFLILCLWPIIVFVPFVLFFVNMYNLVF